MSWFTARLPSVDDLIAMGLTPAAAHRLRFTLASTDAAGADEGDEAGGNTGPGVPTPTPTPKPKNPLAGLSEREQFEYAMQQLGLTGSDLRRTGADPVVKWLNDHGVPGWQGGGTQAADWVRTPSGHEIDYLAAGSDAFQWNPDSSGGFGSAFSGQYPLSSPNDLTQAFDVPFGGVGDYLNSPAFSFGLNQLNANRGMWEAPFTDQFQAPPSRLHDVAQGTIEELLANRERWNAPFTDQFQAPPAGLHDLAQSTLETLGANRDRWDQPFTEQFTPPRDVENTPGYKFSRDQGLKAIDRGGAARGTLLTIGNQADRATFAEGLAQQVYGDEWNRAHQEYLDRYNIFNANQDNYLTRNLSLASGASNLYGEDWQRAMQDYLTRFNVFNTNQDNYYTRTLGLGNAASGLYGEDWQRAMQDYLTRFNVFNTNQSNYFTRNIGLSSAAGGAYGDSWQRAMQEYLSAFNIFNTNQGNLFDRNFSLASLGLGAAERTADSEDRTGDQPGPIGPGAGSSTVPTTPPVPPVVTPPPDSSTYPDSREATALQAPQTRDMWTQFGWLRPR